MLLQEMNNFDEIDYFSMNDYQNKIGVFVKLISMVFMGWKNSREFKIFEKKIDRRSRHYP